MPPVVATVGAIVVAAATGLVAAVVVAVMAVPALVVAVVMGGGQEWFASTRRSPCSACARQASALTLISTHGLLWLPVWWQTGTLPAPLGEVGGFACALAGKIANSATEATKLMKRPRMRCRGSEELRGLRSTKSQGSKPA